MTDTKLTAVPTITTASGVDLLYLAHDPYVTPVQRAISASGLFQSVPTSGLKASSGVLKMETTYFGSGSYIEIIVDNPPITLALNDDNANISFGSAGDISLYRSAKPSLATSGSANIAGGLVVGSVTLGAETGNILYTGTLYSRPSTTSYGVYGFYSLASMATSGSFNGNAFSTVGTKTAIGLTTEYGLPSAIKAVSLRVAVNDNASASTSGLYFGLSQSTSTGVQFEVIARPSGLPNGYYIENNGIVSCDSNGEIYYQCVASGTNNMHVYVTIIGYFI